MHANTTELNDRNLRSDGAVGVAPDKVIDLLVRGIPISKIKVLSIDDDVKRFNQLSDEKLELYVDDEVQLNRDWLLPKEFKTLDLDKFVQNIISNLPENIAEIGEIRLNNELQDFKRRNLLDFLRTIIFIVHELKSKNIICGVGRGSSCASYLLFKIGLHAVDSLKYGIPLTEFFHD